MVSKSGSPVVALLTLQFAAALTLAAQAFDPAQTGSPFRAPTVTVPSTPQAVQSPPNLVNPLVTPEMHGDIFMAKKMFREAVDAYKDGDNSALLLNKTGIAYHQLQDLDDAKKYYTRAVKANPRYSEAINNLGTVEYSRKNYRRAISLYKKALREAPRSASIYSNLGTGYFARKDYKAASEAFETALELDPEVFEHRGTHGVLLQEKSVEERAKFHFYLARLYAKSGSVDRALMYMRKALEEGFKDRKKFLEDPEFAALREHPEYKTIMAMEQRVL